MEAMIYSLLALFGGMYFVFLFLCFINWGIKSGESEVCKKQLPLVSIVIAFKDEELVLQGLLESLKKQLYSNYELILVNDHSNDDFMSALKPFLNGNVTLYHQEEGRYGKKEALELGVSKAKGEFVLFSDADCEFPTLWISSMVDQILNANVDWVAGSIRYELGNGILSFFQALESAYLVMVSAFTISNKVPTTCNGANIIIKKSVFLELNGFDGVRQSPSGDDELFMQKLFKNGGTISYNYGAEACVKTKATESWRGLFIQRIRWGSKLKHNLLPYNFMLSILIFGFHLSMWFLLFYDFNFFIFFFGVRFILELWGGVLYFRRNKMKFNLYYFLISFLLYPLYVIFMAIATQFFKYNWKGRRY